MGKAPERKAAGVHGASSRMNELDGLVSDCPCSIKIPLPPPSGRRNTAAGPLGGDWENVGSGHASQSEFVIPERANRSKQGWLLGGGGRAFFWEKRERQSLQGALMAKDTMESWPGAGAAQNALLLKLRKRNPDASKVASRAPHWMVGHLSEREADSRRLQRCFTAFPKEQGAKPTAPILALTPILALKRTGREPRHPDRACAAARAESGKDDALGKR